MSIAEAHRLSSRFILFHHSSTKEMTHCNYQEYVSADSTKDGVAHAWDVR